MRGLFTFWRRERDSNPRYAIQRIHTFQACAFNHSATSPNSSYSFNFTGLIRNRFKRLLTPTGRCHFVPTSNLPAEDCRTLDTLFNVYTLCILSFVTGASMHHFSRRAPSTTDSALCASVLRTVLALARTSKFALGKFVGASPNLVYRPKVRPTASNRAK